MSTVYAASCNPSRRAKQPNPPPILPMPSSAASQTPTSTDTPPAKRGRKPGTLSRSARETQRKLNHSIIEKARRTKINDALASLKVLVPHDYGSAAAAAAGIPAAVDQDPSDDDGDDEDDKDGDYGSKPAGKAKKQAQPKEPKEFKLEILVRTVAYMQFLLKRVGELEENLRLKEQQQVGSEERVVDKCKSCIEREAQAREEKKKGKEKTGDKKRKRPAVDSDETIDVVDEQRRKVTSPGSRRERLPSISSWLPNCLPPSPHAPYLPSPPASSQFTPAIPVPLQMPPALSLGPSADILTSSAPAAAAGCTRTHTRTRTPEEESAATLLLHMSSSPVFLPHPSPPGDACATPSPVERLGEAVAGLRARERSGDPGERKTQSEPVGAGMISRPPSPTQAVALDAHLLSLAMTPNLVAQTPSSILGLRKRRV